MYTDGAIRLVKSPFINYTSFAGGSGGRLEIFLNGRWGTVCLTEGIDQTAADLVCRQLGYGKAYLYGSVGDLG